MRPRSLIVIAALLWGTGTAAARPRPVLGPDGATWLGPLPPGDARDLGEVLVDPDGGGLHLAFDGKAGRFEWTREAGWRLDGEPVVAPDEQEIVGADGLPRIVDGRRWNWEDGALSAITLPDGGELRVDLDDQGRVDGLAWPGGRAVRVQRDGFGRVTQLQGPGTASMRLAWRDGGVEVARADGEVLRVQTRVSGDELQVDVSDGAGRVARTRWSTRGTEDLLGWTDPRGNEAVVQREPGALALTVSGQGTWRMQLTAGERLLGLTDPAGRVWRWQRDEAGALIGIEDPAGRRWSWLPDQRGRLVEVGQGGTPWRLRRGADGQVDAVVDPLGNATLLERDAAGRITRIVDPAGGELQVLRHATGRVARVASRVRSSWELPLGVHGGVARVQDSAGDTVELRRDLDGHLVALEHSRRGTWRMERGPDGRLRSLTPPGGVRWGFAWGAGGLLRSVEVPDTGLLELVRDRAGDVVRATWDGQDVGVTRDIAGRPVRAGAVSWERDGSGDVRALKAPGRSLRLARDPAGLLRRIEAEDASDSTLAAAYLVDLVRDAAGRVVRWTGTEGEILLQRDASGRPLSEQVTVLLSRPAPPAVPVGELPRDLGAGDTGAPLLPGAAGGVEPEGVFPEGVEPDGADPSAADGGDSGTAGAPATGLALDPSDPVGSLLARVGRLPVDRVVLPPTGLSWTPRGDLAAVRSDDAEWRTMRDAAGRVLRLLGPDGRSVGVDRDRAGRPVLVRLLVGGLVRHGWKGAEALSAVQGIDGVRIDGWARSFDGAGGLAAEDSLAWGARRFERDGLGRLRRVLEGEAALWERGRTEEAGPSGELLIYDEEGRIQGGRAPLGVRAFGVGSRAVQYAWSEEGALAWVVGEAGAVGLSWDALGRLEALTPEAADGGGRIGLHRDARGRLAVITRDGVVAHQLSWAPALDAGTPSTARATLLRSGSRGEQLWWSFGRIGAGLFVPGGGGEEGEASPDRSFDLVMDADGSPLWVLEEDHAPERRSASLRLYPERDADIDALDLIGAAGALQPLAGGPLLPPRPLELGAAPGDLALDPLAHQRMDGLRPFPWDQGFTSEADAADPLDPAPWASVSAWRDPLSVLVGAGLVEAPVADHCLRVETRAPVVVGVPASLDMAPPPLGLDRGCLPRDEIVGLGDPDGALVGALLETVLPRREPLDQDDVLAIVMEASVDLPWLPPGFELPLPTREAGDLR